eukprot:1399906-Pleurochrysis_carterae.AAC.1
MGREEAHATPMYVYNSRAVELSKERRSCQRLRHVDRRDLKIGTDDNVADVFTKSLSANAHPKHVNTARSI